MSFLLMDMGNSRCKAIISGMEQFRVCNQFVWDNDSYSEETWLSNFAQIKNESVIQKIIISSVSSDETKQKVSRYCEQVFALTPNFLASQDLYAIESKELINSYDESLALGVDRWLAMIGAFERTDKAFAVLDAGTAITLDLVDQEGQHLGGHIVPGVKLMQKALFGNTGKIAFGANLDRNKASTEQWLGNNSLQAVELGTYQAALGYLSSCLERLKHHYQIKQLFVCGGDGAQMMKQISMPRDLDWIDCPDLVLEGLFYQYKNG